MSRSDLDAALGRLFGDAISRRIDDILTGRYKPEPHQHDDWCWEEQLPCAREEVARLRAVLRKIGDSIGIENQTYLRNLAAAALVRAGTSEGDTPMVLDRDGIERLQAVERAAKTVLSGMNGGQWTDTPAEIAARHRGDGGVSTVATSDLVALADALGPMQRDDMCEYQPDSAAVPCGKPAVAQCEPCDCQQYICADHRYLHDRPWAVPPFPRLEPMCISCAWRFGHSDEQPD